jgi:beta-lactamase regulating signal transducer with metallopeptidase domain
MTRLLEIGLNNAVMAAALALLAAGLCRLYCRPAFAHGLWLVVLLKLVSPPLVTVALPWFSAPPAPEPVAPTAAPFVGEELTTRHHQEAPGAEAPPEPAVLAAPGPQDRAAAEAGRIANPSRGVGRIGNPSYEGASRDFLPASWAIAFFVVWLVGSLGVLAWTARSVLRFQRLLRFGRQADPSLQALVNELAGRLQRTRPPQLWLVPGRISPLLWTLGVRPRIFFPVPLLERLNRDQLRTILLHELAHWRRRDHWVRLLELVVLILYWWHPVVWWVRAELRVAEEQCCDAWVVGVLGEVHRTYALALLETVAFFSQVRLPLPIAASGIGQVSQLRRRLTMIMSGPKRRSLTWAGCAGLLAFGLLLLPLSLGRAGPPAKQETRKIIVVGDNGSFQIVLNADDSPEQKEQKALELLKQARKLLAEKDQAPAAKRPNPAEIKEARRQVDALARQAVNKRRELQQAEARLRQAQARLAQLEGKPAARIAIPWRMNLKVRPEQGAPKPKVIGPKGKAIVVPKQLLLRIQDGKIIAVPGKKEKPNQPSDLKARLDRLLREVEALRREVERTAPPRK